MDFEQTRKAYSERAEEYTAALGSIDAAASADRELIVSWARERNGLVLDAGCGPGHWTDELQRCGVRVRGLDPVPAFVESARRRFPAVTFEEGRAERLDADDGSVAGILAWYSLIHTPPERIAAPLGEFARALRPGGGLLLGCFTWERTEPFAHAVVTAWRWSLDELADRVADAGFTVTATHTRTDPGQRPHGALVAVRDA